MSLRLRSSGIAIRSAGRYLRIAAFTAANVDGLFNAISDAVYAQPICTNTVGSAFSGLFQGHAVQLMLTKVQHKLLCYSTCRNAKKAGDAAKGLNVESKMLIVSDECRLVSKWAGVLPTPRQPLSHRHNHRSASINQRPYVRVRPCPQAIVGVRQFSSRGRCSGRTHWLPLLPLRDRGHAFQRSPSV